MSQTSSPWPVAAWAMATLTIFALSVAIAGRVLSPTLVLDLVAFWPLLIPVVPSLATAVIRPQSRLAGMAPMFVLTWLLAGLALHLSGSDVVPSAEADVTSSVLNDESASRLEVEAGEGKVTVGAGDDFEVRMDRTGGRVGAPLVELIGSEPSVVSVVAGEGEGWFRFGGMTIVLPDGPVWGLSVDAPVVDIDVGGLAVREASVSARAGWIRLGPVSAPATLEVTGPLRIEIPAEVAVTVVGSASVPPSWVAADVGLRSPASGPGWAITVTAGGGTVAISHP